MSTQLLLVLSLTLIHPPAQDAARQTPTLDAILANVRTATGAARLADYPDGVRLTGPAELFGNSVRATLRFDAAGRFVREIDGPIPYAVGWDGSEAWQVEFSGRPRRLELGERAEQRIIGAALTGSWLRPDAPLRLRVDESASTDALIVLGFEHVEGFETGRIEIGRVDWLPRRWVFSSVASQSQTIVLDEYAPFGALTLPRKIAQTTAGGARGTLILEDFSPLPSGASFAPPRADRKDLAFDPAIPAALEVERAPTGHLLVRPLVAGREVGWFIFDTGAGSSVLDQTLARELEVARIGSVTAMGAGGAVESDLFRLPQVALGPMRLDQPVVIALDLAFLTAPLGRRISGIVGYDLISRCVVELDLEAGRIALHDPAAFKADGVEWKPLALPGRVPAVESTFEGGSGLMRLDTGASGMALLFHQPAVERFKLLDQRETRESTVGGVGGGVATRFGRLAWLELAGHRFEQLDAGFVTEPKGAFASPYTAGVVGGPLLRKFTIVIDYANRRIALRKP